MVYIYTPKGVCSRQIEVELEGETIKRVQFVGGCNGNSQGISALAIGMNAREYIKKCKGIICNNKQTSCPAQLAIAIEEALKSENINAAAS